MDIPSIIDHNYYVVRATKTNRTWICEAERFDDKDSKLYFYYGTYELGSDEHKNNDYLSDSYYDILPSENDEIRLATMEEIDILMDILEKNGVVITLQEAKDKACKRTHEDVIFDSIIWHLRNSVNNGKQNLSGGECEDYFREVVKKNNENKMKSVLAELLEHIKTTSKEELEREFEEIKEWSNVGPTVEEFRTFCECVNRKPKYPTTYAECCEILVGRKPNSNEISFDKMELCLVDLDNTQNIDFQNPYLSQLNILFRLRMCRDAYWKIAGEEMGLGKPWEPKSTEMSHAIVCRDDGDFLLHRRTRAILIFPTEEMRNAFYENFKDLIEQCKELL